MPFIPQPLIAIGYNTVQLLWSPSTAADCVGYDVLLSGSPNGPFHKVNGNQIAQGASPSFTLANYQAGLHYVVIRSYDQKGNYIDSIPFTVSI